MASESRNRVEPGSVNIPVGKFPPSSTSTSVNAEQVATEIIDQLNTALAQKDYKSIAGLFLDDGFWRDHLCLSWDFRTIKGSQDIAKFLADHPQPFKLALDHSSPFRAPHIGPIDAFGDVTGIEFFVSVTTAVGSGWGVVRLAETDGWKIFTCFTSLRELTGAEEKVNDRRPVGVQHGEQTGRKNWQDRRAADINFEDKEPAVVIIGAGQSGLTAAARLKMLDVDTLVVDREDTIGDNWRTRYHQLVLHDPVWFDHMPYVPFPPNWPIFTPKDKLAEFFECYAKLLELNVWTRTELKSSSYDDATRTWTLTLQRTRPDGSVETRTLHPRHVIQATGHSGKKNLPAIKGMDTFQGGRICHSSDFPGADANGAGRHAVVVGSCNSAHDIAQDYTEKGWTVTMVQRSSTCVVTSASITNIALKGLYDASAPPTDEADVYLWSIPSELFKAQQAKIAAAAAQNDAPVLDGLARAGFCVDRGPDDTGLLIKYLQRGGGYYIDVGASRLIAEGKIAVRQGQEIAEIRPDGLRLADGSDLRADEIVLATGYQNMRTQARELFGDEVADRVNSVWGFNAEGEVRTMWQRSGHPGFWFMGGNLALCRYYSLLLALQIAAVEKGIHNA
ncbi:putative flavo protein [Aspergillus taichungensis]|uniref:Putative flavo protein n=1 Tax=Aspergillus taichungensis TaxID=482145 RepID=A0A2J5HS76_9EURO|nr:putative flavo protein [Aspergillus taichungensis]